jgi:hypothetical protein
MMFSANQRLSIVAIAIFAAQGVLAADMALSVNQSGAPGAVVTTALTIDNVGGLQMESLDIDIQYDPAVLTVTGLRCGPAVPEAANPGNLISCSFDPPIYNPSAGGGNELLIRGLVWNVPVLPDDGHVLLEIDFQIDAAAAPGVTEQELLLAQVDESPSPCFDSVGSCGNATKGEITVYLPGDVNNDGVVSVPDLLLMERHLVALIVLDAAAIERGDLYPASGGDGQLALADLVLLSQLLLP